MLSDTHSKILRPQSDGRCQIPVHVRHEVIRWRTAECAYVARRSLLLGWHPQAGRVEPEMTRIALYHMLPLGQGRITYAAG